MLPRRPSPPALLCCGSLIKYAAVAAGVVGAAAGGGAVVAWDHAAGVGLVEAVGGRVTTLLFYTI